VYTTTGLIGAENITHIKLTRQGDFRLELTSLKGDADLYISDKTLQPDYSNYELQSATCGVDVIVINQELARPVGIGIYGHPIYEESVYQLDVYELDNIPDSGYVDYSYENESEQPQPGSPAAGEQDEEESLVWNIFISILKICFEVLLG
jgi:hypothetical protein